MFSLGPPAGFCFSASKAMPVHEEYDRLYPDLAAMLEERFLVVDWLADLHNRNYNRIRPATMLAERL